MVLRFPNTLPHTPNAAFPQPAVAQRHRRSAQEKRRCKRGVAVGAPGVVGDRRGVSGFLQEARKVGRAAGKGDGTVAIDGDQTNTGMINMSCLGYCTRHHMVIRGDPLGGDCDMIEIPTRGVSLHLSLVNKCKVLSQRSLALLTRNWLAGWLAVTQNMSIECFHHTHGGWRRLFSTIWCVLPICS